MTTRLDGPLRRELDIGGMAYTLTLDPEGLHLAAKGRRKGYDLRWEDFINGEEALAVALNASLGGEARAKRSRAGRHTRET